MQSAFFFAYLCRSNSVDLSHGILLLVVKAGMVEFLYDVLNSTGKVSTGCRILPNEQQKKRNPPLEHPVETATWFTNKSETTTWTDISSNDLCIHDFPAPNLVVLRPPPPRMPVTMIMITCARLYFIRQEKPSISVAGPPSWVREYTKSRIKWPSQNRWQELVFLGGGIPHEITSESLITNTYSIPPFVLSLSDIYIYSYLLSSFFSYKSGVKNIIDEVVLLLHMLQTGNKGWKDFQDSHSPPNKHPPGLAATS